MVLMEHGAGAWSDAFGEMFDRSKQAKSPLRGVPVADAPSWICFI